MNKDEILEKNLGGEIVVLTKQARRESCNDREIQSRIAESLRQIFGALRRPWKSNPDHDS